MTKTIGYGTESHLVNRKEAISTLLPDGWNPDRFIKGIATAINKNPYLRECTSESVVLACLDLAELGLQLSGPFGEAYLVPYNNKKGDKWVKEAQLQIGYQGLMKLVRQEGDIGRFDVGVVYGNDYFVYRRGTEVEVTFSPLPNGDRGDFQGVYALAETKDHFFYTVWLPADRVGQIKRRALSKLKDWQVKSSPWTTDEDEMRKKTALRNLCKMLDKSSSRLRRALEIEDAQWEDVTDTAPSGTDSLNARLGLSEAEPEAEEDTPTVEAEEVGGTPTEDEELFA